MSPRIVDALGKHNISGDGSQRRAIGAIANAPNAPKAGHHIKAMIASIELVGTVQRDDCHAFANFVANTRLDLDIRNNSR